MQVESGSGVALCDYPLRRIEEVLIVTPLDRLLS